MTQFGPDRDMFFRGLQEIGEYESKRPRLGQLPQFITQSTKNLACFQVIENERRSLKHQANTCQVLLSRNSNFTSWCNWHQILQRQLAKRMFKFRYLPGNRIVLHKEKTFSKINLLLNNSRGKPIPLKLTPTHACTIHNTLLGTQIYLIKGERSVNLIAG